MTTTYDVFGLGQCSLDHLITVPGFPEPDGKVEGHGLATLCGGPVATALHALARWGRRCAFAGVVGDDEAGGRIRADLEAAGIDTSGLVVRKGALSQMAFIPVEEGTGRRQIIWQRPTGRPLAADEVEAPQCRVFLTDGLHAEASVAVARTAELTVVDAGSLREGTEALLDHADVFIASAAFARSLIGRDDPREACRRIRDRGARFAGVTLGPGGSVALTEKGFIDQEAYPVRAVDTTGCGDVFHAGVVEGILSGWTEERSLRYAAWAAAGCATETGGRAGVPRREDFPP